MPWIAAMVYTSKVPFQGQLRDALTLAISALTTLGFRVAARDEHSIDFMGPGMHSTRQNALLGATHIRLEASAGQLALMADLGGVRWLRRFVLLFPASLCLGIGVTLIVVFAFMLPRALQFVEIIVGANVLIQMAVWAIVGPLIVRRFQARCQHSLDALIANMAAASEL
jgi:hypothetical protein